MMSRILLFVIIVGNASAATWTRRPPTKSKEFPYQEGCYIEELNRVVPYGVQFTPSGHCYEIRCSKEMIEYFSCGAHPGDNCVLVNEDLTKSYPDCCPSVHCGSDENIL